MAMNPPTALDGLIDGNSSLQPPLDEARRPQISQNAFLNQLNLAKKDELLEECTRLNLKVRKRDRVALIKEVLGAFWYPFDLSSAASGVEAGSTSHLHSTTSPYPAAAVKTPNLQTHATPPPSQADIQPDTPPQRRAADHNHNCTPTPASPNDVFPLVLNPLTQQAAEEDLEAEAQAAAEKIREEVELIEELGLAISADAQDVAEFDTGADIDARILRSIPPKEDSQTPLDNDDDEDEDADFMDDEEYEEFVVDTRKKAAARAEGNRRIGGVRTQKAVEKAWNEFCDQYIKDGKLKTKRIVTEHSLLLFIDYTATRCKRTTKGVEIPGSFVGASQQKKFFFGALRIRKQQEAEDPTLRESYPLKNSTLAFDAIKNRMNEAVQRTRSGLVGPEEDAPDIILNTFLDTVTDEELSRVGKGFLEHRELKGAVHGHLAWSTQNASGNRGDDVRALKISELQPHEMLHPDSITKMSVVLGLQGEEKAGLKGMQTASRTNPVYTCFMAHRHPERCPVGALAIHAHYLWDLRHIEREVAVDWELNKSWRRIRLLSGKHPEDPMSEQSLYKLFVQAFKKANFFSKIKQHLPRHIVPFKQESMGVSSDQTSKLGWKRGQTYHDVYAPGLPKQAILAAHGFGPNENYDPVWTQVHVPSDFLRRMCPMAEAIVETVEGKENLRGTTQYWKMMISLRPRMFQSAAAIYQISPNSPIFKLPALKDQDVQNWMREEWPEQLKRVQAEAGEPIALERLQNDVMGMNLRQLISAVSGIGAQGGYGFDTSTYLARSESGLGHRQHTSLAPLIIPQRLFEESSSTATTPPSTPSAGPAPQDSSFEKSVNLILPPNEAFQAPDGSRFVFPLVFGQKYLQWPEVFSRIKQPEFLWDVYKPSKTLDGFGSVANIWTVYAVGEDGGAKPPLRLVEKEFGTAWRRSDGARKVWQRFREIPEWIEYQADHRKASTSLVIDELEELRASEALSVNKLMLRVKAMREEARVQAGPQEKPSSVYVKTKKRAGPVDPRKPAKRKRNT